MQTETTIKSCPFQKMENVQQFTPEAEDILTDEDLLELFRIIKQIIRKKPDTERVAKLYFCIAYAMGDRYQFFKPKHSDHLIFKDETELNVNHTVIGDILLPTSAACCQQNNNKGETSLSASPEQQQNQLSVSYLTNPSPSIIKQHQQQNNSHSNSSSSSPHLLHKSTEETTTDQFSVRPYTNIRPIYPTTTSIQPALWPPSSSPLINERPTLSPSSSSPMSTNRYPHLNTLIHASEVLMEPKQRGFYYQDGRISREPALLQRYAEQGVLTQASLLRKRKKQCGENEQSYELLTLPAPAKKPKIPHRHGEFKQRRDDIISRMRTILMADLEQKAQRLPQDFSLTIEHTSLPENIDVEHLSTEEAGKLLEPALRILTFHSNMKPHLDNGMNQNGIYYNNDYFRLYLAFVQFQTIFAELFPHEVIRVVSSPVATTAPLPSPSSMVTVERDKDRERNANMKAYRGWIEPYLTETNWAAFRRNIMVGERIMQLSKVVGQGILLMTKELSGSKLHLTFTNNEWEEFIQGLSQGLWDETIDWSHDDDELLEEYRKNNKEGSLLVNELRLKFATHFWFTEDGKVVPPAERKAARVRERQILMNKSNPSS